MRSPRHEPLTSNRHRSYNGRLEDNVQLVSFHLFTLVLQMFNWSHSICLHLYYKCSAGLIPLFTLVLQMFSWSHSICLLLYCKCSTGLIPFVYSCITNVQLVSFHCLLLYYKCSAGLIPFVYSCIANVQLVSFHLFTLVLQMYFTLELLHYAISKIKVILSQKKVTLADFQYLTMRVPDESYTRSMPCARNCLPFRSS